MFPVGGLVREHTVEFVLFLEGEAVAAEVFDGERFHNSFILIKFQRINIKVRLPTKNWAILINLNNLIKCVRVLPFVEEEDIGGVFDGRVGVMSYNLFISLQEALIIEYFLVVAENALEVLCVLVTVCLHQKLVDKVFRTVVVD